MPTQGQFNTSIQINRKLKVKIELLNFKFQVVDVLEGVTVGSPSFSNDSNSDIRRNCTITIHPKDSSFDISEGNKIWMDKYIRVYVGTEEQRTEKFEWVKMGTYLINNPEHVYSNMDNQITIQGLDLMAKITGLRYGNLEGIPYMIPQGSNVRLVMISLLEMSGFFSYSIEDLNINTPYDINTSGAGTVYNILTQLRDIYPNYQMYFDVDGVFNFNRIPNGINEQVMVDDTIWERNLLSYNKITPFDSVKNVIEVWGKTHEVGSNYGGLATVTGNQYNISFALTSSELYDNMMVGFTTNQSVLNPTLKINEFNPYPIKNEDGTYPVLSNDETYYVVVLKFGRDYFTIEKSPTTSSNASMISGESYLVSIPSITELNNGTTFNFRTPINGANTLYRPKLKLNDLEEYEINNTLLLENNTSYKVTFIKNSIDENQKYYKFMGEVQPHYTIKDENPDSPFYVYGNLGEIRLVLQGGEYDNINTDMLAKERAEWELYSHCRLQDTVNISCVPIYWLDTNWLIEITLPSNTTTKKEKYLIKSISTDTMGTQSISMIKYYPYLQE